MRVSLVIDGDASGARAAAQQASAAVSNLGKNVNVLAALEQELERAVADVNVGMVAQRNGTNNLGTAHGGLSSQAMAAQHSIRSMVEQIALGVPPTQVLTGQLNHLTFAASGKGGLAGAFKEATGSLIGLINPTTLVVGSIAGLAAGAALAVHNVIQSEKALDDLSRATDQPIARLHALQAIMSAKGIGEESFSAGITEFADKVFEAQHNAGSLNSLMIANGKSAKDLSGYMSGVADLVARASSDIQKQKILREAGLPSDAAWVRFMEQGGAHIQAALNGTVQFNQAAELNLIKKAREFDEAWNATTTKLVANFKSATVDIASALANIKVPDWLKTLADKALTFNPITGPVYSLGKQVAGALGVGASPNFSDRFGAFDRPGNSGALQSGLNKAAGITEPKTREQLDQDDQKTQQRVGLLGQLATADQLVAAKQAELNIAARAGVSVSNAQQAAILNLVRAQAEMTRVQQQASIGVFDGAAAQKAMNDQLKAMIDAKLIDPTNMEQMAAAQTALARSLRDTADAAKVAGSNLPQLQQAINDASNGSKQLDQFMTSSFSSVTTGLADIFDGTKRADQGFADLSKTILRSLTEMLIKVNITLPIFQSLQSVIGGGTGTGAAAGAFSLKSLLGFDAGGYTGRGGRLEWAGIVHRGEYVFDQASVNRAGVGFFARLHRNLRGYDQGGLVGSGPVWTGGSHGGGDIAVNVINNVSPTMSVQARQSVDGRGTRRLELTLDDQNAAAIARPGSATRKALQNNFAARPVGVKR
jgi:hypothetical protein